MAAFSSFGNLGYSQSGSWIWSPWFGVCRWVRGCAEAKKPTPVAPSSLRVHSLVVETQSTLFHPSSRFPGLNSSLAGVLARCRPSRPTSHVVPGRQTPWRRKRGLDRGRSCHSRQ
uniref:Uncharacterized protein n=1 Tax=Coccidioides posadasii RMSCC 3488 TaxID=454284 RepID=A0A0J6FLP7_COCPO|nr:hypothetical protein CPAG_06657 [Coccidioides posadasii RMSCC 3488]